MHACLLACSFVFLFRVRWSVCRFDKHVFVSLFVCARVCRFLTCAFICSIARRLICVFTSLFCLFGLFAEVCVSLVLNLLLFIVPARASCVSHVCRLLFPLTCKR
jgi:hypothetical protein